MCCELDSMSELSGFVYIKSHVILHVKCKAQKVNYMLLLMVTLTPYFTVTKLQLT